MHDSPRSRLSVVRTPAVVSFPGRYVADAVYPDWNAVYRDNVERIYRLIYGKVGNHADAEDLTSEVFKTVLGPMSITRTVGEVRAYLHATASTALAAHWRRTLGREITYIDQDIEAPEISAPVDSQSPDRVNRLLRGLPPNYRRILELRFLLGYSVRGAAEEMGITVANAKVLQMRALRRAAQLEEGAS